MSNMNPQPDTTRVFISSSMRPEGEINWHDIRKKIANRIEHDGGGQFSVSKIEDGASPVPSAEYYLDLVERADIVVCIIAGDIRPGTDKEAHRAIELGKPLLLYFVAAGEERTNRANGATKDESDEVTAFRSEVITRDYCTYKDIERFEQLPERILSDLQTALTWSLRKVGRAKVASARAERLYTMGFVDAPDTILAAFGNAPKYLRYRLGLVSDWKRTSGGNACLEQLGIELVDWALDGRLFDLASFEKLLEAVIDDADNKKVLSARRSACTLGLAGDYANAAKEEAGIVASIENQNDWLRGTALIDIRNYQTLMGDNAAQAKTQKEIEEAPLASAFPIGDHYVLKVHKTLANIEEFYRENRNSRFAVNNRIHDVADDCFNYLAISAAFGVFSHMRAAVKELGSALLRLAPAYDMPVLGYWGFRLHLLSNDSSIVRACIKEDWGFLGNAISSRADEIWESLDQANIVGAEQACCTATNLLISYVSDETAALMISRVFKDGKCVWILRRQQALLAASLRMDADSLCVCICSVLKSGYEIDPRFGQVLTNVDAVAASAGCVEALIVAIRGALSKFAENQNLARALAFLACKYDVFREVAGALREKLTGEALAVFNYLASGGKDSGALFGLLISRAKTHVAASTTSRVSYEFGFAPFDRLVAIVDDAALEELPQGFIDDMISLVEDSVDKIKAGLVLDEVMRLGISLALMYRRSGALLDCRLVEAAEALASAENSSGFSELWFSSCSKSSCSLRVAVFEAVCGIGNNRELVYDYLAVSMQDLPTRKTMVEALPYLVSSADGDEGLIRDEFIVLNNLSSDVDSIVRGKAARAAVAFAGTPLEAQAMRVLVRLSSDAEVSVRNTVIDACTCRPINNQWKRSLLNGFTTDANYHLRRKAKRTLDEES